MDESGPLFERMAYASSAEGPYAVYLMGSDGSQSLLAEDSRFHGDAPAWSPDGRRLAVSRGQQSIFVVGSDGHDPFVVPLPMTTAQAPAWAHDGSRLVFLGTRVNEAYVPRVYIVAPDGTGLQVLTSPHYHCGPPAVSPTDGVIATTGFRAGDTVMFLYRFDEDGSQWAQVADIPAEGRPAWSPDGMQIAFAAPGGRLWVIGRDGSDPRPVGDIPLGYSPVWTPGGSHLTYQFSAGICDWIYVVGLDGSEPQPLVDFGTSAAFAPAGDDFGHMGRRFSTSAVGSFWAAARNSRPNSESGEVTVASDVERRIADASGGSTALRLQNPSDLHASVAAMVAARTDILALEIPANAYHRPQATLPVELPGGPLIAVSADGEHPEAAQAIPRILKAHLTGWGVSGSLVSLERPDPRWSYAPELGQGVTLWLYPAPPPDERTRVRRWRVRMPERWLESAGSWVTGAAVEGRARVGLIGLSAWLSTDELLPVARFCHRVGWESVEQASFHFVSGLDGGLLRGAHASLMGNHWLQLGAGGAADESETMQIFDELVEVANGLAPETEYSCVTFDDNVRLSPPMPSLTRPKGAAPETVDRLCDEITLDAFPYQVLGPGHLARLEAAGAAGALTTVSLEGDRRGVALGHPDQWLAGSRDVQYRARQALAACIVDQDEARALLALRHR